MNQSIRWSYILLPYFSLLAMGFVDNIRGSLLLEFTEDLGFTDVQASLLFAVPTFFVFFGCQVSNFLLSRTNIHPLRSLSFALLVVGFGFFFLSNVTDILSLVLSGTFFGIGLGMLGVLQNVNIHIGSSEKSRRRFLSGLHSMYALSALCAPIFIKYIFSWDWVWRKGFFLASLLPIVMGFLFLFFLILKKEKRREGEGLEKKDVLGKVRGRSPDYLHYIYMGVAISFYLGCELAVGTRLILYVRRYTESTAEFSTYYLILFFALLFLGRVLFLFIDSMRWRNESIWFWCAVSTTLLLVFGLCFSPWWISLSGLTMGPLFAVSIDYTFEVFKERASEAVSYVIGISFLLVFPIHYMIGKLSDMFGLRLALVMVPFLLISALVMISFRSRFFGGREARGVL